MTAKSTLAHPLVTQKSGVASVPKSDDATKPLDILTSPGRVKGFFNTNRTRKGRVRSGAISLQQLWESQNSQPPVTPRPKLVRFQAPDTERRAPIPQQDAKSLTATSSPRPRQKVVEGTGPVSSRQIMVETISRPISCQLHDQKDDHHHRDKHTQTSNLITTSTSTTSLPRITTPSSSTDVQHHNHQFQYIHGSRGLYSDFDRSFRIHTATRGYRDHESSPDCTRRYSASHEYHRSRSRRSRRRRHGASASSDSSSSSYTPPGSGAGYAVGDCAQLDIDYIYPVLPTLHFEKALLLRSLNRVLHARGSCVPGVGVVGVQELFAADDPIFFSTLPTTRTVKRVDKGGRPLGTISALIKETHISADLQEVKEMARRIK